jgi:hypothetical protein
LGILHGVRENILLRVEKEKISLWSPKTELRPRKMSVQKIYPLIVT